MTDRKKWIVEAATKSFASFGYKATTMEQVAKIANVGKGTIYTFFTNKEQLFDEILREMIVEMQQISDREYNPERSFFDNLERILHKILDFRDRHELAQKLASEVRDMGTSKAREALQHLEAAIVGYIQVKVQLALDKGEIRQCNPELTAYLMFRIYLSLTSEWQQAHPPLTREEITESFRTYLMLGLQPREAIQ